ncbi:MAG: hypothetical protein G8345_08820 [Magnetococcales bacterium]|nr:hypothetical protein [Magnetococcales bacterium]
MDKELLAVEMNDALRRAALYHLLASSFRYPGGAGQEEIGKEFQALLQAGVPWPEGVYPLLAACPPLLDEDISELESQYLRLFGPGGGCVIHETAYGDSSRLLGKPNNLSDISGFYLAFGFTPAPGSGQAEDHLSMELEFMSLVNVKEAMAINEGWQERLEITRDVQKKFLGDHLGAWLDIWYHNLGEHMVPDFYQMLSQALMMTVHADLERLGVEPVVLQHRMMDREVGGDELICPMAEAP